IISACWVYSATARQATVPMLYKAVSAAVYGIDANIIEVEVDVSGIKTNSGCGSGWAAALPVTTPHNFRRRVDWWRCHTSSRRSFPGAQWRAFSGRAARVSPECAGGHAAAA